MTGPNRFFDGVESVGEGTGGGRTSVRDLLYDAERRLHSAGVPSPDTDAALLMAWVLGVPRTRLFLHDVPTTEQGLAFERAVSRRLSRVPLQHITGTAAFRRLELEVGPGVFIPRPETELLAETCIRALREVVDAGGVPVAVDLCCGSGAIGLSLALEVPGTVVHLVELDPVAAQWARKNVASHQEALRSAGSTVEVVEADAGSVAGRADSVGALSSLIGRVDVVAANPPYIPDAMVPREVEVRDHDPAVALYGGTDGLDVIRRVAHTAALLARPGGVVVIEHADVQGPDAVDGGVVHVLRSTVLDDDMATLVPGVPGAPAFIDVKDRLDLNGLPRFSVAVRAQA